MDCDLDRHPLELLTKDAPSACLEEGRDAFHPGDLPPASRCPAGQRGITFGDNFGGFICNYDLVSGRFVGGTYFQDTRQYCERTEFRFHTEEPFEPCVGSPPETAKICPQPDGGGG